MKYTTYNLFNVISNKTRWKIIMSLYNSDKYVSEICDDLNEEQSKISHNLKILSDCNVVFYKKDGKKVIYSLNKKTIKPLIKILQRHISNFCSKNCRKDKLIKCEKIDY